jgi:DNA-binding transcriptional regulator YiaG
LRLDSRTLLDVTTIYAKARAHVQLPAPDERRRIRESAGLTQADLAAECAVDQSTAARWEAGAITPRGEHLLAYGTLLLRLAAIVDGPA